MMMDEEKDRQTGMIAIFVFGDDSGGDE